MTKHQVTVKTSEWLSVKNDCETIEYLTVPNNQAAQTDTHYMFETYNKQIIPYWAEWKNSVSSCINDTHIKNFIDFQYISFNNFDGKNNTIDKWHALISEIDLNKVELSLDIISNKNEFTKHYRKWIDNLCIVARDYSRELEELENLREISLDSIRSYLYLLPVLEHSPHHVSIDSDTGFISIGINTHSKATLNILVADKKNLHFSLIGKGYSLKKIFGTAKVMNVKDFTILENVLRML